MNNHLQLFRFFHENEEPIHLEKNLARAFALCLKNDKVLLFSFLSAWLTQDDFNFLLSNPPEDAEVEIDIERETGNLVENTRRLYAIGITENVDHEDWNNILIDAVKIDKSNFTDIIIIIKDITIIIEIKRTREDCKAQLLQQMLPFTMEDDLKGLNAFHLPWETVLQNIKMINHFHLLNKNENHFTISFLQLIERRYNHWIPTSPFRHLAFSTKHNTELNWLELDKRLEKAMRSVGKDSFIMFPDRKAIMLKKPWASEAIPEFEFDPIKPSLMLYVWPGNTKQQGYAVYNKSLDWIQSKAVIVGEYTFDICIERHLKFMHFNKYITHINIPVDNKLLVKKEINTYENFYGNSGRWDIGKWDELDDFLSEHLNMDWKKECGWYKHFENTDRSYLTLALGFSIQLRIPYSLLQDIDKYQEDYRKVGELFSSCINAIIDMVENCKTIQNDVLGKVLDGGNILS